jgi:DNA-binding LacI/PurR family transcriptional regulator
MRRPTLDDIADRVGVSRGLVSLTLRDLPGAGPETRAAILRAARDLGYVANAAARNLASNSSSAVGVLVNDLHNAFFADVIDGLRVRLTESGLHVLMGLGVGLAEERAALDLFRGYQMRGAVLVGPEVREREIDTFGRSIATVIVGRTVRSASVDVVTNDDRRGAMLAVQHLYELGHRDIAHLDGPAVPGGGNTRRRGYVDAMRALGLENQIRIAGGGFTLAHAADGVDRLVSERVPTAIFAASDVIALGALERLAELGLSCPADVSVVGYDNSSYAAQRRVGLTSIDQPRVEMGELAAMLLEERFGGRTAPRRHVLAPKLVERETTSRPRRRRPSATRT